ncbi:hypothetical protein IID10_11750 [candidate division KSB1 bacterium]|nr:hypothetical protein [candidate division KSB1 bacterium]
MKINNLYGAAPPKKLQKQSVEEARQKKIQKKESSEASKVDKDQVFISEEAKELQKSDDKIGKSKELLAKLPSSRAHVIYEALAKMRAGLYESDEILQEAATKLIKSGELDNLDI